jgi:hypothetical protein
VMGAVMDVVLKKILNHKEHKGHEEKIQHRVTEQNLTIQRKDEMKQS